MSGVVDSDIPYSCLIVRYRSGSDDNTDCAREMVSCTNHSACPNTFPMWLKRRIEYYKFPAVVYLIPNALTLSSPLSFNWI